MSKRIVLFLLALVVTVKSNAQTITPHTTDRFNYYGRDYHRAQFVGGVDSLASFFSKNRHYPDTASILNIEGRVIVRFLVNEAGKISNLEVIRSIGGGCDEEAKRLVAAMPAWLPATYKGRPVKAVEVLPIIFKLD